MFIILHLIGGGLGNHWTLVAKLFDAVALPFFTGEHDKMHLPVPQKWPLASQFPNFIDSLEDFLAGNKLLVCLI